MGKSSLLNALSGEEQALPASTPGTTRDYIDVPSNIKEFKYNSLTQPELEKHQMI